MTEEDEEFNRIEREAAMRTAAVKATITKREWVGLRESERDEIWRTSHTTDAAIKATEDKLREKNT